jgi:hypothetical protein
METGWDELLRSLAADFKGFINGLDSLHYFIDHNVYKSKLKGPSFREFDQSYQIRSQVVKNLKTVPFSCTTIQDARTFTQL